MNPAKHLTVFDFYCNSFEELPTKMKEEVGFKVLPRDIWSIDIRDHEMKRLHVTLTLIYWSEEAVAKRIAKENS